VTTNALNREAKDNETSLCILVLSTYKSEAVSMPDKTTIEEELKYYTAKAGDVARQLAFVGIAIVWLFRYQDQGITVIPKDLQKPLSRLVLVLAIDGVQYLVGSILWGVGFLQRATDEAVKQKKTIITLLIFVLVKLLVLGWAYATLLCPVWVKIDFL